MKTPAGAASAQLGFLERTTRVALHDESTTRSSLHLERIGYVPADRNEVLARLMDGGKALSAKLTGKEKIGAWNKLRMEVSLED